MEFSTRTKVIMMIIFNAIFAGLVLTFTGLFMTQANTVFKFIASGIFILECLGNILLSRLFNKDLKNKYIWLIFISIVLCALGDITIEFIFEVGGIFFALGHIGFVLAFLSLSRFRLRDFVISAFLTIGLIFAIIFVPFLDFGTSKPLICIYAFIIGCMVGKAISNSFTTLNKPLKFTILAAALMFLISDTSLMIYTFGGKEILASYLCHFIYYPSCIVFTITVLISSYTQNRHITKNN